MLSSEMPFSESEKAQLLEIKGVGETVLKRLEQIGYGSLEQLRQAEAADITLKASQLLGSTCWHNSPLARKAIQAAIDRAKELHDNPTS